LRVCCQNCIVLVHYFDTNRIEAIHIKNKNEIEPDRNNGFCCVNKILAIRKCLIITKLFFNLPKMSLEKPGYEKVEGLTKIILSRIYQEGGFLNITDKCSPDKIFNTVVSL
jgi:hypothetical protein